MTPAFGIQKVYSIKRAAEGNPFNLLTDDTCILSISAAGLNWTLVHPMRARLLITCIAYLEFALSRSLELRAKYLLHVNVMPSARVRVPETKHRPGVLATPPSPPRKTARYPVPPPGYATIAHARSGGWSYQPVQCQTLLWSNRIAQPMMYRPGHCGNLAPAGNKCTIAIVNHLPAVSRWRHVVHACREQVPPDGYAAYRALPYNPSRRDNLCSASPADLIRPASSRCVHR
ncbi:hypothetical protein SAMN05216315_1412 [Nitrosospira sp. Nsp18]|nr:hypothetical protein SAMN05216315_1412 [Nitrosospira sp. Nsp18]